MVENEHASSRTEREFALPLTFCFILALKNRIMSTNTGESRSFLVYWIQMLVTLRNILTDTPRSNGLPAIWASLGLVELTHKINYHSELDISVFTFRALDFLFGLKSLPSPYISLYKIIIILFLRVSLLSILDCFWIV